MQIESEHPTATKLRLFALHSLKPSAADHVEAHVEQCPSCTGTLERVQAEHNSIRSDLRSNGLSAHITEGGPVSVWVVENGSRWCIRLIGPMVHLGDSALGKGAAIRKALLAFANAFPEHECSGCAVTRRRETSVGHGEWAASDRR
jgi:hypothetical protein